MNVMSWFLIPALAATLGLAQEPVSRKVPAKPAAKSARRSGNPEGVPADAQKISDFEWSHTDKDGKSWIYRKTPFAVAKLPDDRAAAAPPTAPGMTARDLGESVEFSRKTPFGVATWTKKKTELDAAEEAAWKAASGKGQE